MGVLTLQVAALGGQVLGWIGNAFYFSRFLVQWLQSERAQKTVAPRSFWWLSLFGAITLGTYAFLKPDQPLFVGYALTFSIYLRNLSIAYMGPRAGRLGTGPAVAVAALLAGVAIYTGAMPRKTEPLPEAWTAVGFVGQAVFSSRFVVQWFFTERRGESHFPRAFWWLSLVGNTLLLAYACRLGDPVFIAGFALGPLVQVRNLMLSAKDGPDPAPAAG